MRDQDAGRPTSGEDASGQVSRDVSEAGGTRARISAKVSPPPHGMSAPAWMAAIFSGKFRAASVVVNPVAQTSSSAGAP